MRISLGVIGPLYEKTALIRRSILFFYPIRQVSQALPASVSLSGTQFNHYSLIRLLLDNDSSLDWTAPLN